MIDLPAALTGGFRPGDERFEQITGRRAMVEATLATIAAAEPTHRGPPRRRRSRPRAGEQPAGGVPHVAAVVLATGERIAADLVVDCSGRRSTVPTMLESIGATRPVDELGDAELLHRTGGAHRREHRRDGGAPAAAVDDEVRRDAFTRRQHDGGHVRDTAGAVGTRREGRER